MGLTTHKVSLEERDLLSKHFKIKHIIKPIFLIYFLLLSHGVKCPTVWYSWLLQLSVCKQYVGKDWDSWTGFLPELVE